MQVSALLSESPLVILGFVLSVGLLAVGYVALGFWVHRDAMARGSDSPAWWTLVALSGIGLPWYLVARRRFDGRDAPPAPGERLAAAWITALALALVVGAAATPPDPVTQVLALPPLFAGALLTYFAVYRDGIGRDEPSA